MGKMEQVIMWLQKANFNSHFLLSTNCLKKELPEISLFASSTSKEVFSGHFNYGKSPSPRRQAAQGLLSSAIDLNFKIMGS